MFSLGCVLLEILSLHRRGSLHLLRAYRETNPAYHANVNHLSTWLKTDDINFSRREHYLECEINLMLSADPERRPKAIELLHGIAAHDIYPMEGSTPSVFGDCCKRTSVPQLQLSKMVEDAAKTTQLTEQLKKQKDETRAAQNLHEQQNARAYETIDELHTKYREKILERDLGIEELKSTLHDYTTKLPGSRETNGYVEELNEELQRDLRSSSHYVAELQRRCKQLEEQLRTQNIAFQSQDSLQGRTLDTENAMYFETELNKGRDRSSHSLNDSEEHDRSVAQPSTFAGLKKLGTGQDQGIDQSSPAPKHHGPRQAILLRRKNRRPKGSFDQLSLYQSSGQIDTPVTPQSDENVEDGSQGANGTKKKVGIVEVISRGYKAGLSASRQAAKDANWRRTTIGEVPERPYPEGEARKSEIGVVRWRYS